MGLMSVALLSVDGWQGEGLWTCRSGDRRYGGQAVRAPMIKIMIMSKSKIQLREEPEAPRGCVFLVLRLLDSGIVGNERTDFLEFGWQINFVAVREFGQTEVEVFVDDVQRNAHGEKFGGGFEPGALGGLHDGSSGDVELAMNGGGGGTLRA